MINYSLDSKNKKSLMYLVLLVVGMLALSFASVPLYDLFCRVTGYAGTVSRSDLAPGPIKDTKGFSKIKIRFDANISKDLEWEFQAPSKQLLVEPGVEQIVYYFAQNISDKTITATATFNVSPPKAGATFMKIDCFCFVNQTLNPGEQIKMPVVFYIDPKIYEDKNMHNLQEITLSYTFFKVNLDLRNKNV